jgi:hypothetical protein
MLSKLKRALRVYRWLSSLEQRADSLDLLTKSDYKHPKLLIGTLLSRMIRGLPVINTRTSQREPL